MSERIHFIVAKSREGWSVNVEADRLSEHARREDARAQAEMLTEQAQKDGAAASLVDLSDDKA
jgi:hypothetical protein